MSRWLWWFDMYTTARGGTFSAPDAVSRTSSNSTARRPNHRTRSSIAARPTEPRATSTSVGAVIRAIAPSTRTLSMRDMHAFYAEVGDVVAVPRFADLPSVLPCQCNARAGGGGRLAIVGWSGTRRYDRHHHPPDGRLELQGPARGSPGPVEVARRARGDRDRRCAAQRRGAHDPPGR